ncbi:MAG: hypothetical protein Q7U55_09025 [Deltaproteobacteria bacterium]|nr:hypothetical protein [Deltaproteobacteria bacterium]
MQTEQRGAGLRQQVRDTWTDTERKQAMTTGLAGFTQRAQELRKERMTSLMGMLFDPEGLRSSFERQDERKAPGVDGVRKASPTFVEDSNWEPDGVTHHVRFCEGPGVTVGWLRSCGTAGKPGGNRENKHQPVLLGEPGLLTKGS